MKKPTEKGKKLQQSFKNHTKRHRKAQPHQLISTKIKILVPAFLSLLQHTLSLTHWFDIKEDGKEVYSGAIAGPAGEYVFQGKTRSFTTYLIDWSAGTTSVAKEITLSTAIAHNNWINGGKVKLIGDAAQNVMMTSQSAQRFNIMPGKAITAHRYITNVGPLYTFSHPRHITNTTFFIFGCISCHAKRFYRAYNYTSNALTRFSVTYDSRAYGVIYQTGWLMISSTNTDKRTVFDYTRGYIGGANRTTDTHTKTGDNLEVAFMAPEDGRLYYTVFAEATKILYTVKFIDGSEHLNHNIGVELGGTATSLIWVYDTDLVVVTSASTTILLLDFMDKTKTTAQAIVRTINIPSGGEILNSAVWLDKRALFVSMSTGDQSSVFRIATADQPCSDLCATCHDLYRKQCLTCKPNSSPGTEPNTCKCDSNYFEVVVSYTDRKCVQCHPICQECNGLEDDKCTSCKDPNGVYNGDGTCGCKDGYYLSGAVCVACDESCLTCSAGGASACLTCDQSKGRYKDGTTCPLCHTNCLTCATGAENQCLSCDPTKSRYKVGTTCPLCDSSCLECTGPGPNACSKCDAPKSKYLSGTQCLGCHAECLECSGPESTDCTKCDQSKGVYLSGGSCVPCDSPCLECSAAGTTSCFKCDQSKGVYLKGTSCVPCDSPCRECTAGGLNSCFDCDQTKGVYLSGTSCLTCDSPCLKCSAGGLNSCSECDKTKAVYLDGTSCVDCDPRCLECDGAGSKDTCSKCDQSKGVYLDGKSCVPCDSPCLECTAGGLNSCFECDQSKGVYLAGSSCLTCHSSCKTCDGGSASSCLSCSQFGYFLREKTCVLCTEATEEDANALSGCPAFTQIGVEDEIDELVQNLTISFTPSFKSQMDDAELETANLTAKRLLEDFLEVKFKGTAGEVDLTLLEMSLNHSEPARTTLFVSFLEKLRFGKTEYIKISVKKGLILRTVEEDGATEASTASNPTPKTKKMVYFRLNFSKKIKLKEGPKSEEEAAVEAAQAAGAAASAAGAVVASVLVTLSSIFGNPASLVVYLVKFFNVIDGVSSFGNLNVRFGSRIETALNFIDSIKLPDISLFHNLSPFDDAEPDSVDSSAYQTVPRGSRGKMTHQNAQIFLASGQNFFFSLAIIGFWALMKVLERCLTPKSKLLGFISLVYRTLIGLVFFDFQAIAVAEISFSDFDRLSKAPSKFLISLFLSMGVTILILVELLSAVSLITNKRIMDAMSSKTGAKTPLPVQTLTPSQRMTFDKYTEVLDIKKSQQSQNSKKSKKSKILLFWWSSRPSDFL